MSGTARARLRELLGIDRLAATVPARIGPAAGPADVAGAAWADAAPGAVVDTEILAADGTVIPAHLLRPDPARAHGAAVVLVAGHGRGIDDLVRTGPADEYHGALAHRVAAAGFTVLCPEMQSFGRRRSAPAPGAEPYGPADSSCRIDAPRHLLAGTTLLGRRVLDAAAAADALRALPGVDPQRVAVAGGSGGGAVALLLAALDETVAASLVATFFCTFEASILAMPHCPCNIVPGLFAAEDPALRLDMADIARLIAPRPLVLEAGEADRIFPIAGTRQAHALLPSAWTACGAAAPPLVVTDQAHRFVGEESVDLLAAALS